MNREDFKVTNWDTMNGNEQDAWLSMFVLDLPAQEENGEFTVEGAILERPSASRVSMCELSLQPEVKELYVANCLTEASHIAYKGLEPEEVRTPEVARKFYEKLLLLPVDVRARCMYWAVRGERA